MVLEHSLLCLLFPKATEFEGDSESDYFGESEGEDGGVLSSADDEGDVEFSVDEMRAELERLMADLRTSAVHAGFAPKGRSMW